MNDHNLEDIIVQPNEPQGNTAKSFLTIIALAIVVLIVGIILTKTLIKNSEDESLSIEQNYSDNVSSDLDLEKNDELDDIDKELSLSNIIDDEPSTPPIDSDKSEKVAKSTIKTVDESKPSKKVEDNSPAVYVPSMKKVKIPESRYTEPEPTYKKPKAVTPIAQGNFYIKVGAYTKPISSRFLSVIKNNGFRYKITSPSSSGLKKLLIGPYNSRASANSALNQVQDRINKNAYIVKL